MIPTSIVGFHLNPWTCGVAKFNAELARRLDVPHLPLFSRQVGANPLLSLKWSELDEGTQMGVRAWARAHIGQFDVFWHDTGDDIVSRLAFRSLVGDASLRSDALPLWCPPTLSPLLHAPYDVSLLTFGMAHKLQTAPYERVLMLLTQAGLRPRLRVSVALHEATSLDDVSAHFEELREMVGADRLQILGVLSDTGLVEALRESDVLLAFFGKGVRSNNTTVLAAMAVGCPVLTLLDQDSPPSLTHGETVMDLAQLDRWPPRWRWREVGAHGRDVYEQIYTWEALLARLEVA